MIEPGAQNFVLLRIHRTQHEKERRKSLHSKPLRAY
jgi:hypothetical protein